MLLMNPKMMYINKGNSWNKLRSDPNIIFINKFHKPTTLYFNTNSVVNKNNIVVKEYYLKNAYQHFIFYKTKQAGAELCQAQAKHG